MLEIFFRAAFYVILGLALAGACVWYVQSLYHALTGRGEVVIAPIEVIGTGDTKNRGMALAQMLHVRLGEIERDLRVAQRELTGAREAAPRGPAASVPAERSAQSARAGQGMQAAPSSPGGGVPGGIELPLLLTQPAELNAKLLEPADINISVGGVQVGGVIPWLQRLASNPRSLVFTVYESKEGAQLSGSLQPLGMRDEGVRIDMGLKTGQDAVPMDKLVEQAAYEIVRRRLAADASNKVEVLSRTEFQALVEALRDTAALNRRVALGRVALPEFQELLTKIAPLADEVPEWFQLNYLAGSIAESAKDLDAAVKYYGRVVDATAKDGSQSKLHDKLTAKVASLEEQRAAAAAPAATPTDEGPVDIAARQKIEEYAQTATSTLNGLIGHRLATPRVKIVPDSRANGLSYWDGRQVVVPEAAQYLPDIVYRESSWPHILRVAGSRALDGDDGSTEAILYSYADVLPMVVQQRVLKQDEKTSRWELGPGWVEMSQGKDLAKVKTKTPYLSFAALGTSVKGASATGNVQVAHMRDFDSHSDVMQRKYVNSGIFNKAFYEAARRLGTAKAADIWIAALKQLKSTRKVDFPRFATMLSEAASEADRPLVREALLAVGLDPQPKLATTTQ